MPTPTLGREVLRAIGRELRTLYAGIIGEGVPDHFAAILRQLDAPDDDPPPPEHLSMDAPSTAPEQANQDDDEENGNETHESRICSRHLKALARALGLALASPAWRPELAA